MDSRLPSHSEPGRTVMTTDALSLRPAPTDELHSHNPMRRPTRASSRPAALRGRLMRTIGPLPRSAIFNPLCHPASCPRRRVSPPALPNAGLRAMGATDRKFNNHSSAKVRANRAAHDVHRWAAAQRSWEACYFEPDYNRNQSRQTCRLTTRESVAAVDDGHTCQNSQSDQGGPGIIFPQCRHLATVWGHKPGQNGHEWLRPADSDTGGRYPNARKRRCNAGGRHRHREAAQIALLLMKD